MVFQILTQTVVIGSSALEHVDMGMGVAHGAFSPTPAYLAVRQVFAAFRDNWPTAELESARDALELQLIAPDGAEIPTQWIHIYDLTDETDMDGLDFLEVECILQNLADLPTD